MVIRPSRLVALFLSLALLVGSLPVQAADRLPGAGYGPGPGEVGPLSTIPSYDDLDEPYRERWDPRPPQAFSPNGDGVQDTVTFTWEETYPGREEAPGQPAIPPGAETSLWVMLPARPMSPLPRSASIHWWTYGKPEYLYDNNLETYCFYEQPAWPADGWARAVYDYDSPFILRQIRFYGRSVQGQLEQVTVTYADNTTRIFHIGLGIGHSLTHYPWWYSVNQWHEYTFATPVENVKSVDCRFKVRSTTLLRGKVWLHQLQLVGDQEHHFCIMPTQRVGPGQVEFTWDGRVDGTLLGDNWYYWYTRRTDPETGAKTTSLLGRVLIDTIVTEARKVITRETGPGQLEIRVQGHDDRSGVRDVGVRVLEGETVLYSSQASFEQPIWRWWPDQEWAHCHWSPTDPGADYTLEVSVADFGGNTVTERLPLGPPVNRTGEEAWWPLVGGRVLGQDFRLNAASGNLLLQETDLQLPGLGPSLKVLRSYSHQLRRNGALGWGFSHSYEERLEKDRVDGTLVYTDADGSLHLFQRSGTGVVNPPGLFFHLEVIPDPNGRDESYRITRKDGRVTEFNLHGRPVAIRDRSGNATTLEYNVDGTLARVTDPSGRSLVFGYEGPTIAPGGQRHAKLSRVEELLPGGPGRAVEFTYSPAGDLVATTNLAGVTTLYSWDDRHRLTGITVSRGGVGYPVSVSYGKHNALAGIHGTRDDGVVERWTAGLAWDGGSLAGGTCLLSDPLGTHVYRFNGEGNLTALSRPEGGTTIFGWSANLLQAWTDPYGNTTTLEYDARGNLTARAEPGAPPTRFTYSPQDDLVRVTDPLGRVTTYGYDAGRNLVSITDPRGGVTSLAYYPNGLLRRITRPAGATAEYAYDTHGNLTTIADGLAVTTYQHDAYGHVTRESVQVVQGGAPSVTTFENNLRGQPVRVVSPVGTVTTLEYDENGNRTRTVLQGETGRTEIACHHDASSNLRLTVEAYTVTEGRYDTAGNLVQEEVRAPGAPAGSGAVTEYGYDHEARLVSVRSPIGGLTVFRYDLAGRPIARETGAGVTEFAYDPRGNLVEVREPEGGLTRYVHNEANQRTAFIVYRDGSPITTRYSYNTAGDVESVEHPDGRIVCYVYDLAGNPTAEIHYGPAAAGVLGVATAGDGQAELLRRTFSYDQFGRLLSVSDGEGNTTHYAHDHRDNLTRTTDPTGVTAEYRYDAAGRLVETRDAAGLVRQYSLDYLGNVITLVDQGGWSSYTYDCQGRLAEMVNRAGGRVTFTHDAADNRTGIASEVGDGRISLWTFGYDAAGNITSQRDGEGFLAHFEHDALGRCVLERREGLNGHETVENRFDYDGRARMTRLVDARGNETLYRYDTLGNLTAMYGASPPGTPLADRPLTTYQYDVANRLAAATDALGATTRFEYDLLGNQTAVVDARGGRTEYEYDRAGRLTAERRFLDETTVHVTTFTYDGAGRLLTVTDANGHTRRAGYDAAGRVVAVEDALGNVTRYEYDLLGRQTAVIDPLGRRTEFTHDASDWLTGVRDPLGGMEQYVYNYLGDVVAEVDRLGGVTGYVRDLNSRVVTVTDPRGLADRFAYDGLGNRMAWTDAAGQSTTYVYDPRCNLVRVTEPAAPVPAVTLHGYDPCDRHVLQQDPEGRRLEYGYDLAGRLLWERSPGLTLQYRYDAAGNRTAVVDGRGETTYTYDLLGRLTEIRRPTGAVETFTYDGVSNLLTRTDPSGTTHYAYDANDRLVRVTDPSGTTLTYDYDAAGQRVAAAVDGRPTRSEFDPAGRLIAYTDTLGFPYEYAYDPAGRLTTFTGPQHQTTIAYSEAGRPVSVETTAGGLALATAGYTYEDRNFVEAAFEDGRAYRYAYDARGQLVEVVNPYGDLVRYAYDGAGNRLRREAVVNGGDLDRGETMTAEEVVRLVLRRVREERPELLDGDREAWTPPGRDEQPGPPPSGASDGGKDAGSAGVKQATIASQGGGRETAPGQTRDKTTGPDGAPGQDKDDKLTGRENALTRGLGLKIGLLRQFEADEQGLAAKVVLLLERIVNGETRVPPGDMEGLEAIVREVAHGYTIVGLEFTYNQLNQLTSVHDPLRDETFDYTWDGAGGLVRTGTADLAWDEQGRLVEIVWADGWGISFSYDAQGRCLSRTTFNHRGEDGRTTTFHYLAGTSLVLYEEGPDGLRLDYTYDGQGRRLTITCQDRTYWYVYNGHGDVVGLVNGQGILVAGYEYDDHGRVVRMWGPDGRQVREGQGQTRYLNGDITVEDVSPMPEYEGEEAGVALAVLDADPDRAIVKLNPYRYAGYRYDRETDLYFLETRYYDPWSNRFLSRDSHPGEPGLPLSLNRYLYALNNPVNYVDPAGEYPILVPLNVPWSYDEFYRLDDRSRAKVVQAMLAALGLLQPNRPDPGLPGLITEEYLRARGIDGVIGRKTWQALQSFQTQAGINEPVAEEYCWAQFGVGAETYRSLRSMLNLLHLASLDYLRFPWPDGDLGIHYYQLALSQRAVGPTASLHEKHGEVWWPLDPQYHEISSRYNEPRPTGPHRGVDIRAPYHARVYAAVTGTVIRKLSGQRELTKEERKEDTVTPPSFDTRGNYILLKHSVDPDWGTRYLHLTVVTVTKDEEVKGGQLIGTVGNTGRSFGTHLHLDFGPYPQSSGDDFHDMRNRVDPMKELFPLDILERLAERIRLGF